MSAPVSKANADHYLWGDGCDGWQLLARADLHVIHERIPEGVGETAHRHDVARQLFFVLSGSLGMELAGTTHLLAPHDSLEIAPGAVHRAFNGGAGPVEFLVISHPSTRGDRRDETL